jgi:hypothetical protein
MIDPSCPNCHRSISLFELWQVAPKTRFNALDDNVGVVCPHCAARLRVLQGHAKVAQLMVLLVPAFIFVMWLKVYRPSEIIAELIAIGALFVLVATMRRLPRRLAQLKLAGLGERFRYPLDS